jgi:hypothetical protein
MYKFAQLYACVELFLKYCVYLRMLLSATFAFSTYLLVQGSIRLPIKVYYRIRTLRLIRIEINHGSQNVF